MTWRNPANHEPDHHAGRVYRDNPIDGPDMARMDVLAMSLQTTDSHRKPPARQRLSAKLTAALDAMVWDGMSFVDAARHANMNAASMRSALERNHVQAYLRQQRQVFRECLSTRGLTRLVELSEQNDNLTAAVSATRTLLNESDQEHSAGAQRHAPGLVVQIINSPGLPGADRDHMHVTQVIDVAAQPPDAARDD